MLVKIEFKVNRVKTRALIFYSLIAFHNCPIVVESAINNNLGLQTSPLYSLRCGDVMADMA